MKTPNTPSPVRQPRTRNASRKQEAPADTPTTPKTRKRTASSRQAASNDTPTPTIVVENHRTTRRQAAAQVQAEEANNATTPSAVGPPKSRKKADVAEKKKVEATATTSSTKTREKSRKMSETSSTPSPPQPRTRNSRRKQEPVVETPTPKTRKQTARPRQEASNDTPTPIAVETQRKTRRQAATKEASTTATPTTSSAVQPPKSRKKADVAEKKVEASTSSTNGSTQEKTLEWKFNVYGVPKCPLPCRETQFEEVWKFLFENISEKNSGCMYVSGVPGTGKTVIVQAVVDTLKKINEEKKKNLDFEYLYINGLTLASPDKLWKRMFKGLKLTTKSSAISSKEALKRLDSYFETHQRLPVVLVVDELDQILDKQQSILYQLLEWSVHAKNMFSFVAIFNTISLPENGLAMRNYSRMGFKRAVFPPYSYEQLQAIVLNMLCTFKTSRLSQECVSLLSRKVAAISGDARRALEIARRTLEIAESGNYTGIQAVSQAFKEIFSSAKIETIKYTSFLEQMILKTICDEIRASGVEEVLIAKVYESLMTKAVYEGVQYHKDDMLKALIRLAVMRLVIVEDNHPSLHKRLLLKVPVEDVNFALGCHTDIQLEN